MTTTFISELIEAHLYEIGPAGRLCACGWPDPDVLSTLSDGAPLAAAHRAHVADVLEAGVDGYVTGLLADRVDGMPPGVEAALEAAAAGAVNRSGGAGNPPVVVTWDELRLGDRNAVKTSLLPIVIDACAAQIGALRP